MQKRTFETRPFRETQTRLLIDGTVAGKPLLIEKQSKQKTITATDPKQQHCLDSPSGSITSQESTINLQKPTLEKKRFGESSGNPLYFASRYRW